MTRDQVVLLLQLAQAYDSRNLDGVMVAAWSDAAQRCGWTAESAGEAVRRHYATSTERIMPGHVTALVRAASPAPAFAPRLVRALPAAPPPSEERIAEIRESFGVGRRTQEPRNRPQARRWRTPEGERGAEGGPEPVRAFGGDLGAMLRQRRGGSQ